MNTHRPTNGTYIGLTAMVSFIQSGPRASPQTVCQSLANCFHNFYWLKLGKKHPALHDMENKGSCLKVVKGKLYCDTIAAWPYQHPVVRPPDITGLSEYIPGLTIKQYASKNEAHKLKLKVRLDLGQWPHAARNRLHNNICQAFLYHDISGEAKQRHLSEARLLLSHFYPQVTLDLLCLAADLSLIDEDPLVFKDWFDKLCEKPMMMAEALPSDLS